MNHPTPSFLPRCFHAERLAMSLSAIQSRALKVSSRALGVWHLLVTIELCSLLVAIITAGCAREVTTAHQPKSGPEGEGESWTSLSEQPTEPIREADSEQLCRILQSETGKNWIGKPIKLDGIIARIGRDKEGDPYIRFLTKRTWDLRAYASDDVNLNEFAVGERVTAVGILRDQVGSALNIVDCSITGCEPDVKAHASSMIGASTAEFVSLFLTSPLDAKNNINGKVWQIHGVVSKVWHKSSNETFEMTAEPGGEVFMCYRVKNPPPVGTVVVVSGEIHGFGAHGELRLVPSQATAEATGRSRRLLIHIARCKVVLRGD